MDNNINKKELNEVIKTSKNLLKILYILIIVVGIYFFIMLMKQLHIFNILGVILKILAPLFIGVIIAWLFNPFVNMLERKKIKRIFGAGIAYIILISAILLIVNSLLPLLYNQTIDLVGNFPKIFSSVIEWLENFLSNFNSEVINTNNIIDSMSDKLNKFSETLSTSLPLTLLNGLTVIVSYTSTFIIGLVIGFYLLLGWNNASISFNDFIPRKYRKGIRKLSRTINQALRNYVNGALIDALVVFVISSIAFAIIGLKAPLLFGLFCGLMNVIPYAGPYIGGAPAVIVGFSQGLGVGIAILIAIIIIQMVEGNVLQTLIISKTTKLNPVIIIIGLLIFGHFFGIIGMLLSTPIISVVKVIIKYFDDKYDILNFE